MEKWVIYAVISMLFAGLTSVIAKFGMKDLHSDTALAIRTSVVFLFVVTNAFLFRNAYEEIKHTSLQNILFLAVSGLTTTLSWIFYYRAMKEGPVSFVASIDKASIVVTIFLSYFLLKENLTPKLIIGALLILAGLIVLVWK